MRSLRIVAIVASVAVLTASVAASASASVDYSGLKVTGYVESYTGMSNAALAARSAKLTSVGIDGINLTRDGAGVTPVEPAAHRLLTQAHADGDTAELLVGNFSGGDFSPAIATRLLDSEDNMTAVAAALAAEVKRFGWDGVQVDLESLDSSHTTGVTRFMRMLRAELDTVDATKTLSIAIMATSGDYRVLGYDVAAISESTDSIVLMAYDQHGYWDPKHPGPVGGTPWVKSVLAALLRKVPASEVQLGIAGYGYSFPKKGTGTQLSPAAARKLVAAAHGSTHWSSKHQEWHGSLPNGTQLWWSDAKTVDARVALAKRYRLGGVAVWSIGLADRID